MNQVFRASLYLALFSLSFVANANELAKPSKNTLASVIEMEIDKTKISVNVVVSDSSLTAEFKTIEESKNIQTFELPSPVVPQASIQKWQWGKNFPDMIAIEITGGADGESSRYFEIYAVVGKKIKKVFSASYLDNYYFRKATCGKFDASSKNDVYLIEEKPLVITKTRLVWDEAGHFIRRLGSSNIKINAIALEETKVYEKPSLKVKSKKNYPKGSQFEIIGFQFCDLKKDGEDNCSTEPAEKNRWFKIKEQKGKIHWLWEQAPVDSNLDCNQFMLLND